MPVGTPRARNHRRDSELGRYVPVTRPTIRPDHDRLEHRGGVLPTNPLREIRTVGSVREEAASGATVDLNAHEAGNGG